MALLKRMRSKGLINIIMPMPRHFIKMLDVVRGGDDDDVGVDAFFSNRFRKLKPSERAS